jgi:hypothetical protein
MSSKQVTLDSSRAPASHDQPARWIHRLLDHDRQRATPVGQTDQQTAWCIRLAALARVADHHVIVAQRLLYLARRDTTSPELVRRDIRCQQLRDRDPHHAGA